MENEQNATPAATEEKLPAQEATKVEAGASQVVEQPKPDEQTQPKTVLEEEHKRIIETIKGGHKGTVDKMRGEIGQLTAQISELQARTQEQEYSNWLRAVGEKGGDVDFAKQVIERDKQTRASEAALLKKQAELDNLKNELNEAGANKAALDFIKEFNLPATARDELVSSENRVDMEVKARRLAMEALRVQATPETTVSKGQGKPAPRDMSKMSDSEKFGVALEEIEQSK